MTVSLSEEQKEAIDRIVDWYKRPPPGMPQEFFLSGPAGSGKTTIASIAAGWIGTLHPRPRTIFAAFTGKAAAVMRQQGMADASTIHPLIYAPEHDSDGRIVGWHTILRHRSPLDRATLLVVDEVSMVPESIAVHLRSFKVPTLVLGDVDGQLPPVVDGACAFTGRRPDFQLRDTYRSQEGPINTLAWRARRGAPLPLGGPPEACVKRLTDADAWDTLLDPRRQVLCGRNSTRATIIRRRREAAFGGKPPALPSPGEPLICTRNDHNQGFMNGEIVHLWHITKPPSTDGWFEATVLSERGEIPGVRISTKGFVDYKGEKPPYTDWGSALFEWAYAITVHKSQGSEWDHVALIDDGFAKWDRDLRRRWLYTGITRATKSITVLTL